MRATPNPSIGADSFRPAASSCRSCQTLGAAQSNALEVRYVQPLDPSARTTCVAPQPSMMRCYRLWGSSASVGSTRTGQLGNDRVKPPSSGSAFRSTAFRQVPATVAWSPLRPRRGRQWMQHTQRRSPQEPKTKVHQGSACTMRLTTTVPMSETRMATSCTLFAARRSAHVSRTSRHI